jgi:hypothetical protein
VEDLVGATQGVILSRMVSSLALMIIAICGGWAVSAYKYIIMS